MAPARGIWDVPQALPQKLSPRSPVALGWKRELRAGLRPNDDGFVVDWIRRYIVFHGKRHPREMGMEEIYTHVMKRPGMGVRSPLDAG